MLVWALFRTAYPSKSRRMHPTLRCLLCCHKMVVQLRLRRELFLLVKSGIPLSRKKQPQIIEAVSKWLHFLKGRHFTFVTDQESASFMFSQTTAVKLKMLKFFRGVWNSANFSMTSAISPVFITLPYLVRVPLRPVCLSANCTNHSATVVMHDFTTLFGNAICLTPAKRRKLYVDRAELALKLSRVFWSHLFKVW